MSDRKARTVELDEDVHKAVKIKAAEKGVFIREVVNESLRRSLKLPSGKTVVGGCFKKGG
jgi:hypothetical protein